jgi:CHAD domain-containing protein
MRIDFKKLRYALEFFAPLLPRKVLKPYLAVLAQVQGVLGDFNDHATAAHLLQKLAADVGAPLNPAIGPWLDHERETLAAACADALAVWIHADPPWMA